MRRIRRHRRPPIRRRRPRILPRIPRVIPRGRPCPHRRHIGWCNRGPYCRYRVR